MKLPTIRAIRWRLIRWLAGADTIMVNVRMDAGTLETPSNLMMFNCHFKNVQGDMLRAILPRHSA